MSDIKNILQEDDALTDAHLMQYLQGTLCEEDLHAIEKKMADSDFMNDAVEGLQNFKSNKNIEQYVEQLNQQLQKQTSTKKKRKEKRKLKQQDWIALTVVIVLLLCMLGYMVVSQFQKNRKVDTIQQTK